MNGDGLSIANAHDLDTLKAEILREIRTEINKAKQEIIEGKIFSFYIYIHTRALHGHGRVLHAHHS